MRHARVLVLAALAVPVIAAVAFAQSAVTPIPDPPPVRVAPLEVDLAKTTWEMPRPARPRRLPAQPAMGRTAIRQWRCTRALPGKPSATSRIRWR